MATQLTESTASEIAADLEKRWAKYTVAADVQSMLSLFAENVVFLGSLPTVFLGREGVKKYLSSVKLDSSRAVTFQDREVQVLAPNIFTSLAHVVFDTEIDGKRVPFRCAFSWTVIEEDGVWKIAQQHASPRQAGVSTEKLR